MIARCLIPLAALLSVLAQPCPALSAETGLKPADTYAVIVGVLEWKDPSLSSFAKANRKDRELYDALRKLGVPEENMALLLDDEATLAAMQGALERVVRRTRPESTLLFYYAGHGTKQEGRAYFCNYDYVSGRGAQGGFSVDGIGTTLKRYFRGRRVFLTADCCYSGSLTAVAETLSRSGYRTCALASAAASNVSTSNWTFTQNLVDAVRGDPLMDLNRDGRIALREAAWSISEAMKYCEMQLFGYANRGVPLEFILAPVEGDLPEPSQIPPPYAFRQYAYASPKGDWRPGRVLDYRDGKYAVQLQDYSRRPVVWLPPEKLKPIEFRRYSPGMKLAVLWKRSEWEARVVKTLGDFHKITYPGYSSDWDEWVLSNRIVGTYEQIQRASKVNVKWRGGWYPAVILKTEGDKFYVHYTGDDTCWNEWITADRIQGGVVADQTEAKPQDASVGGKYSNLLRKIRVADDRATYSTFHDYGHYSGDSWAGHTNLPPGYWVYVYPDWYIWRDRKAE